MLRVKVVTENGIVHLLGLVTPEEADATADKVRRIPGAKRVVKLFDYVEPKRGQSQTQVQARPRAALPDAIAAALCDIVDARALLTDPSDCWPYGYDNSRRRR